MKKKLIPLFTAVCLILGTLGTFTVFADDTSADITETAKHIHKICADENCTDNHEDIEWTAWDSGTSLPDTAGNYYLTKDVELTAEWEMPDNTAICMNGHIISSQNVQNGFSTAIYIDEDKTSFTLTDCSNTEHKFTVGDKGLWVRDEEHGTKTLTGGVIVSPDNYAVISLSPLNMYNINISGSKGGIFNTDTLNMYGCTVAGNSGWDGVCSYGGLNMRDCNIFENTGDGVYVAQGSISIGGKMIISNNVIGNKNMNLRLYKKNVVVNISAPLEEGSVIGVSTKERPLTDRPTAVTAPCDADYSAYFTSDNIDDYVTYSIQNGENNVVYLEANTPTDFRIMSDYTGTILAAAPTSGTYTAVLATYSNDGILLDIAVSPVTFDEPSVKSIFEDYKYTPDSPGSYNSKLMLWYDTQSMKPCCKNYSYGFSMGG